VNRDPSARARGPVSATSYWGCLPPRAFRARFRPVTGRPVHRPDSVQRCSNGQVSALRTLFAYLKTLLNQYPVVGTGIALFFLRQEGLQIKSDWMLNKSKDLKIFLAKPELVFYLTTTPPLTNTKQAPS